MTYQLIDPSGQRMETTAPSLAKARSNFTWRLTKPPYGLFVEEARDWARSTEVCSRCDTGRRRSPEGLRVP